MAVVAVVGVALVFSVDAFKKFLLICLFKRQEGIHCLRLTSGFRTHDAEGGAQFYLFVYLFVFILFTFSVGFRLS